MKKKVIITTILAVVILLVAFGGMVMAAPTDTPKDDWSVIKEGIENILEKLGLSDDIINNIHAETLDLTNSMISVNETLTGLEVSLGTIEGKIDALDNLDTNKQRIYCETGYIYYSGVVEPPELDDSPYSFTVFDSRNISLPDGAKHFHVYIDGQDISDDDWIEVFPLIISPIGSLAGFPQKIDDLNNTVGPFTSEFTADELKIIVHSVDQFAAPEEMYFNWGVTITY